MTVEREIQNDKSLINKILISRMFQTVLQNWICTKNKTRAKPISNIMGQKYTYFVAVYIYRVNILLYFPSISKTRYSERKEIARDTCFVCLPFQYYIYVEWVLFLPNMDFLRNLIIKSGILTEHFANAAILLIFPKTKYAYSEPTQCSFRFWRLLLLLIWS